MIKNTVKFETEKEGRKYIFVIENDSPLGEIYDVLMEMKAVIVAKISEAQEKESKNA